MGLSKQELVAPATNNFTGFVAKNVLAEEALTEWKRILSYWHKYAPDYQRGGFHGRVDYDNKPVLDAPRSAILYGRILWTFSKAYRQFHKRKYLLMAERAYNYLNMYFKDAQYGGVYWSVTADGKPLDTRKHLYSNAFVIYGLSEYYAATRFPPALDLAIDVFHLIDKYGYDNQKGGYFEGFGQQWETIDDMILTKQPYNKSQNTHLHIIEAFTNLFQIWPDSLLRTRVTHLIDMFLENLISKDAHQLRLFFDRNWQPKDPIISYGHDIEASWLLWETAEILGDATRSEKIKTKCLQMAEAACTGLGNDGALNYEYDPATHHLNTDRSWWVLTEQLVGFINAYQLSHQAHYLEKAQQSWDYIKKYFLDYEMGEWYSTVKPDFTPVKADKISFWKCPYHNSRACYETWHRLR